MLKHVLFKNLSSLHNWHSLLFSGPKRACLIFGKGQHRKHDKFYAIILTEGMIFTAK